ncbi:hypothetical protein [Chitinimonas taiwanensis]|uniref:hypothetical protein n=1 Tax=Chitinimonas taiwanensis TaxID=240412 RepID=UPI0035B23B31
MRHLLLVSAVLLCLCGCAQLRQAQQPPQPLAPELQTPLLRAPVDWGQLAKEAAARIVTRAAQVKDLTSRPIYVSEPSLPTPFARALRQYLQSRLTEQGLTVAQKRADGTLILDAEVQSIKMDSGLQVVVTTAIGNGSRFLFRSTDAYLVNQADVRLYDESLLPPPPAPPAPPTQTKRMNVTGVQ